MVGIFTNRASLFPVNRLKGSKHVKLTWKKAQKKSK